MSDGKQNQQTKKERKIFHTYLDLKESISVDNKSEIEEYYNTLCDLVGTELATQYYNAASQADKFIKLARELESEMEKKGK